MLLGGCSLGELDASFHELRTAADPDERERLDALFSQAVSLHTAQAEAQRRAAGLAAIAETAADLAALRRLDDVLHAVCRRARWLLGTDVAYITLRDEERGDTYVRMTDGVLSDAIRTMRLPLGLGLGGLVAQTGVTQVADDYAADARFQHSVSVDERVRTEGLRAIIATPLRRGHDIIGVLLSGARVVRHFDATEMALFETLGSHAAIALENARVFGEAQQALRRLDEARTAAQDRSMLIERSAALQDRLAALLVSGAGLGELIDTVSAALGGRVGLELGDGTVMGASATPERDAEVVRVPLVAGWEVLGSLWLDEDRETEDDRLVLERCAVLVAGVVLQDRAERDADLRLHRELVDELLGRRAPDPALLRRRCGRLGINLDAPHLVVAFERVQYERGGRWALVRAGRAVAEVGGAASVIDGRTVLVVPGSDARAAAARWQTARDVGDGEPPAIGVGGPARGASGVRAAYRDAVRTLNVLAALGHTGRAAAASELGLFGVLLGGGRDDDLQELITSTLGSVLAHDAARNSALVPTLEAFFEEAGHIGKTARRLGIHVNTLYQRLERLDALLGDEWRAPDARLQLHLAVRLRRLDERIRSRTNPAG